LLQYLSVQRRFRCFRIAIVYSSSVSSMTASVCYACKLVSSTYLISSLIGTFKSFVGLSIVVVSGSTLVLSATYVSSLMES